MFFVRLSLVLVIFSIVCLFIMSFLHRRGIGIGFFISIAILNLLIVVPELSLRVTNFRYESGIQFGYPRAGDFVTFEQDVDLFWKLNTHLPKVNSRGFLGKEFVIPKPSHVFRILFLGDSTAYQGYPLFVERLLNSQRSSESPEFERVSLAVPGYSSFQGKILAKMYGDLLQPNMVIVLYGWNDHWLAYGAKDSEKIVNESTLTKFMVTLHRSKLVQWIFWLCDRIKGTHQIPLDEVRVPLNEYKNNLTEIREIFSKNNVPIIFMTTPTSHYRLGVPDYIVDMKFVQKSEDALHYHKQYNEVVREIARTGNQYLLDLEAEFSLLSEEKLKQIFQKDGIHFREEGLADVAKRMASFIEKVIEQERILEKSTIVSEEK